MAKMIITIGLPASGKTTWAKGFIEQRQSDFTAHSWMRINWDEDREALGMTGHAFSRKAEGAMQDASFKKAREWANCNGNLIIDNTNLSPKTVNKWLAIGIEHDMEVEMKNFDMPVQDCVRIDETRKSARVGRAVIERMALFSGRIDFSQVGHIIVDIDGTLADTTERQRHLTPLPCPECNGKGETEGVVTDENGPGWEKKPCVVCEGRGVPKDFKKNWTAWMNECGTEKLREDVACIVDTLAASYEVLLVSGRSLDAAGRITVDWLKRNNVRYEHLFMRNGGDFRDDTIIKQEILDKILLKLPKEKIILAIDDRPKVVRLWQQNGIKVLDVGNQKEF